MKRAILVTLFVVIGAAHPSAALDPYTYDAMFWLWQSSPTARSWGMAFTDVASIHESPSTTGPGSVGLWALNHNIYRSQTWERQSHKHHDLVKWDVSNSIVAIGVTAEDINIRSPLPLAIGVLYRSGSHSQKQYPNDPRGRRLARATYDWVLGVGADIGIQLGAGVRLNILKDPGNDDFGARNPERSWYAAYSMRMSFQHVMKQLNIATRPLDFGDWVVDPVVSFANDHLIRSEQDGFAYGINITMRTLPVISAERIINSATGNESRGWEVALLGTYAFRRGERLWDQTEYLTWVGNYVPLPDWSTEGHAITSTGLQRWIRHFLIRDQHSIAGWLLDNVSVRYERAFFRHPDRAAPEMYWTLSQLSVREWSFEIDGLAALVERVLR